MAEIQQKFECLPFSSRLHRAGKGQAWLGLEICICSERPRLPVSRCYEARKLREILRKPIFFWLIYDIGGFCKFKVLGVFGLSGGGHTGPQETKLRTCSTSTD
jgi:hypothetical protein